MGGVDALELSLGDYDPLVFPGLVEEELEGDLPVPQAYSSFCWRAGLFLNKPAKSIFIIEFVGMFGVSFSKPPCIKITVSIAQTVCLNR